ncbi:glycosyltransferase family 25 protein [Cladophialophora carrionii]|uniref:Glycosyltransferase family 25 protein n=1 Tax=Cladophialophora carrionii TaxID=86049 RepID=A0A1C1D1H6_9EURO|nr:glycosyltransferase family 25 protein [Cladophialophora carrionii]
MNSLPSQPNRITILAFVSFIGFLFLLVVWHSSSSNFGVIFQHSSSSRSGISSSRQRSLQSIQNATLGFERILAINLPERTDHRDGLILAAAVSNLHIERVDGVHGDTILDKVLPPDHPEHIDPARLGSWRAHMNAISRVVENNWTSALILEDDVDWDIRLSSLLTDFALASDTVLSRHDSAALKFRGLSFSHTPVTSPYGDGWDVLWLGHCGMEIADSSSTVIQENDETVPEVRFLLSWDRNEVSPLADYPPHTRLVGKQHEGVCSLAYAVSQAGARGLLNSLGLKRVDNAFDLMLREWCEGIHEDHSHRCVGVLPQLFDHYRPIGPSEIDSDISAPNGGYRSQPFTQNIRWSVRLNMDKLLRGETDYIDQWPDSKV